MAWQDIDFAMRLYHFINKQYGLDDLLKKRLKIARIMELNDPFEFMVVDLTDSRFREAMEATKKHLDKKSGLLCFSESWDNLAQWAHYADGHKGLCLGFDIPDHLLAKVNYVGERLSADAFLTGNEALEERLDVEMETYIGSPASRDEFEARKTEFLAGPCEQRLLENVKLDEDGMTWAKKIISTKFSHWSYEKEYREFVLLDNKENDGLYYEDFSDDHLNLKEVIIGLRSCVTRVQIEDALGEMTGHVEIFKARMDDLKFAMLRDRKNAF